MVDIAGSGPVHLLGGASAFAGAIMLGPRHKRYDRPDKSPPPMGNPINACVGLFFLWFGWLAFNAGSTYGLTGYKWEYAARAAFMTMIASFAGGSYALIHSLTKNSGKLEPADLINGILASLVAITGNFRQDILNKIMQFVCIFFNFTAGCFLFRAWESIVVGCVGSILTLFTLPLFDKMKIDDPVGE